MVPTSLRKRSAFRREVKWRTLCGVEFNVRPIEAVRGYADVQCCKNCQPGSHGFNGRGGYDLLTAARKRASVHKKARKAKARLLLSLSAEGKLRDGSSPA